MKNTYIRKVVVCALSSIMIISCFTGCGSKNEAQNEFNEVIEKIDNGGSNNGNENRTSAKNNDSSKNKSDADVYLEGGDHDSKNSDDDDEEGTRKSFVITMTNEMFFKIKDTDLSHRIKYGEEAGNSIIYYIDEDKAKVSFIWSEEKFEDAVDKMKEYLSTASDKPLIEEHREEGVYFQGVIKGYLSLCFVTEGSDGYSYIINMSTVDKDNCGKDMNKLIDSMLTGGFTTNKARSEAEGPIAIKYSPEEDKEAIEGSTKRAKFEWESEEDDENSSEEDFEIKEALKRRNEK